jgi:hypothetical protein
MAQWPDFSRSAGLFERLGAGGRSADPSERSRGRIVPSGVVVVYFSKLGGRLRAHQKISSMQMPKPLPGSSAMIFGDVTIARATIEAPSSSFPMTLCSRTRPPLSAFAPAMISTVALCPMLS